MQRISHLAAVLSIAGTGAVASAQAASAVTGVWSSDGYGYVFEVARDTLRAYEVTAISCLPSFVATSVPAPAGALGAFRFTGAPVTVLLLPDEATERARFHMNGAASDIIIRRTARRPETCNAPPANTPQSNFDIFARTWAEQYGFFDLKKVDWASVVAANRNKVTDATTPAELFSILRGMIEPLQDAHTYIAAPDVNQRFGGARTGQNRVPREQFDRAYGTVDRYLTGALQKFCQGQLEFGMLGPTIGYLRIRGFGRYHPDGSFDSGLIALEAALDTIFAGARSWTGFVSDVRINGGGADPYGLIIAGRLTDRDYVAYVKEARLDPNDPSRWTPGQTSWVRVTSRPGFRGPVVHLTGIHSVSAAETFTQALMNRVPPVVRVGENTQGVFSDVLGRRLPNGWRFGLPNERFVTNGRSYDGPGIAPDVRVPVFPASDLESGRDGAIERALEILAAPSTRQRPSPADVALIGRILLAEDRRDSSSAAFAEGERSNDSRVRELARRALGRVRDATFGARDSLPVPTAPPSYSDPLWRLRYRALTKTDCAALRGALTDSAWPVRLRATDLAGSDCAADSLLVSTFRRWAASPTTNAVRARGGVSWHPAAHALLALARTEPESARALLPRFSMSRVPWLRIYAARAAGLLSDTATLRRLAVDANDNVKEAAIDGLAKLAGHTADDLFLRALGARGYQAIRAGARALAGSPRAGDVTSAALAAARRLRRDSSETSRDARLALLERIGAFASRGNVRDVAALADDYDCAVARAAADIAARLGAASATSRCSPMPVALPADAIALALGEHLRLRVLLADSSGGGAFTVRLRGDVAPLMAARVLALARTGYYNGLTWHRVEPDFVIQGGGPGANEFVGHPRFIRDELGRVPHVRGTVGMSTRGHDTGDAQWFVNLRDNRRLDREYTVFAEVVDGIEIVDGILEGDVIARIDVLRGPSVWPPSK